MKPKCERPCAALSRSRCWDLLLAATARPAAFFHRLHAEDPRAPARTQFRLQLWTAAPFSRFPRRAGCGPAPRDLPTGVPAGLVPAPHGLRPEATRGHKEHVLFCSHAVMAQSPLVCRSQVCTTVTPEAQERTAPDLVHRQVVRNTPEPRAAGETVSGRCWWPSSTGSGRCVSQESKRSAARPAGPVAVSQARGSSRPSASGQNQWFAPWDGCPREGCQEEKGCNGGTPGAGPDLWEFWV